MSLLAWPLAGHPLPLGVFMSDTEWLMALATAIGKRVEAGDLPPQDENGFYIL